MGPMRPTLSAGEGWGARGKIEEFPEEEARKKIAEFSATLPVGDPFHKAFDDFLKSEISIRAKNVVARMTRMAWQRA